MSRVTLGRQWRRIQAKLPENWVHARLALTVTDLRQVDRATALLGPLTPGRAANVVRFEVTSRGHAQSPAAVDRALGRLDAERIRGTLELVGAPDRAPDRPEPAIARTRAVPLAETWDALVAELPGDWTDVYAEILLTSSDDLDPAALALAPVNPSRYGPALGFRFRCARSFGYGAAPVMARRSLARLDELGIDGRVSILRVLSDTKPVGTQGPVWYVGGKAV
ncbi:MAG: hypothetical protein ACM3QU_01010 [Verrucomicrobiota bacterium]